MRQVTQNYKSGKIRVEKVNTPVCKDGGALVRTAFSVISAGTEGMKVKEGKMSLVGKAMARPDQVKKVLKSVRQQGVAATFDKVMNKLDSLTPLGYSLSGTVVEVGGSLPGIEVGQRVACAGAEYAHHAEFVYVPRNLIVPVPEGVSLPHAAFATIGAIAMQGFRQAELQLGESACVVGLGLLGQILVRILRAAGIHAIGVDLSPARCELGRAGGAALATTPDDPSLRASVKALTGGYGVDCVIISAGGDTNGPVELAVELARDRARVVDIGKTRLDLPWNDYYMKELDVRFSRSYGPGRYDPNYEERGIDYPIGYVRWTEQRNMASFLDLIAQGKLDLGPIVTNIHPFAEAEQVYEAMASGAGGGLGVLFQYPAAAPIERRQVSLAKPSKRAGSAQARIGVIGAGNYASSMLLPHVAKDERAVLVEVATQTALSAANAQRKFGFERSSTDSAGLLKADDVGAVLIATRHGSHPSLAAAALRTGRPVFVEKPLAIDRAGVETVRKAILESGNDRLQVGFNRRFAPLVVAIAEAFAGRTYPLFMNYRVHAGQMESSSWYLDGREGSRFVGEGGHFLDVFAYLTGSRPVSVSAACLKPAAPTADHRDNLCATVTYADGSVGNLLYLTQGGTQVAKEQLEVFGGGMTAYLDNFTRLDLYRGDRGATSVSGRLDKGQQKEMAAFVEAVVTGGPLPIGIDCLIDTTLATLAADESLTAGRPVAISEFWSDGAEEVEVVSPEAAAESRG